MGVAGGVAAGGVVPVPLLETTPPPQPTVSPARSRTARTLELRRTILIGPFLTQAAPAKIVAHEKLLRYSFGEHQSARQLFADGPGLSCPYFCCGMNIYRGGMQFQIWPTKPITSMEGASPISRKYARNGAPLYLCPRGLVAGVEEVERIRLQKAGLVEIKP